MPEPDTLVLVTWRDAFFQLDYDPTETDCIAQTVGWVLDNGGDIFLTVASETVPGGFRAVTNIPIELISEWKEL